MNHRIKRTPFILLDTVKEISQVLEAEKDGMVNVINICVNNLYSKRIGSIVYLQCFEFISFTLWPSVEIKICSL